MRCPSAFALAVAVTATSLSACTWVPIEPSGKAVRVIAPGPLPAGCRSQGEVVVSVKDKIGFVQRNALKVKDELETLARNEAPSAGANAVQARGEPVAGSQRFTALQCGGG